MKTVKFITAMLIMYMTVGVTSIVKAQVVPNSIPYEMLPSDINDGLTGDDWDVTIVANQFFYTPPTATFQAILDPVEEITITLTTFFDLSNVSSFIIDYRHDAGALPVSFKVFIDGVEVITQPSSNYPLQSKSINSTDPNMNFNQMSEVKIEMKYLSQSGENFTVYITNFKMYNVILLPTSINDNNDISDKINVYSYNKSVFITADEFMDNADITVYNMNGQIVHTSLMNLSNSKSELALNDINSGMYIVNISNGVEVVRKKVVIQ